MDLELLDLAEVRQFTLKKLKVKVKFWFGQTARTHTVMKITLNKVLKSYGIKFNQYLKQTK